MAAYDRNADRLHDLALAITRDRAVAAHVVGDAVVAAAGVGEGWDPRRQLYAAVRAEAFTHLAGTGRLPSEHRVIELPHVSRPPTHGDVAALLWQALAAYGERDQALLTLHLRHRLAHDELAHAMGLSTKACQLLLQEGCHRVRRGLWALLLLLDPTDPRVPADARDGWDGTFSPYVRRRVAGVVPPAPVGTAEDPLVVLQALPLVPAPPALRDTVEQRLNTVGPAAGPSYAVGEDTDDTIPPEAAIPLPAEPPGSMPATQPVSRAADAPTEMLPPLPPEGRDRARNDQGTGSASPAHDRAGAGRPWGRTLLLVGLAVAALGLLVVAAWTAREVLDRREESAAVTTSPVADPDPPPTPVAPGQLTVPAGDVEVTRSDGGAIALGNAGEETLAFSVVDAPDWARIEPDHGTIDGGSTVQVEVVLRDGLVEGDYTGPVVIGTDAAGQDPLAAIVTAAVEEPPVLSQVSFGTRMLAVAGCGRDSTEVAVVARDATGLESVSVILEGPAAGQQRQVLLTPADEVFIGVVGPFDRAGSVVVVVEAVDVRGNTAMADAGEVEVAAC